MTKYVNCTRKGCGGEVELTFERERADDGEWYVMTDAVCSEGCEFNADEIEAFENANPVDMDDINQATADFWESMAEAIY